MQDHGQQTARRPRRVRIQDCTLREGEQSADVNLSNREKVHLARLLCEAGVAELEYGCPGQSAGDAELGALLKAEGLPVKLDALVQIFIDDWKGQIDTTIAGKPDIMNLAYPSSDIRLAKVLNVTRATAIARCREAVAYAVPRARDAGIEVGFLPTDTTRAAPEFLSDLATAAVEGGATMLTAVDTSGSVLPHKMAEVVARFVSAFGAEMPIRLHCHNDHGLALANTLAGFEAGATILNCTINGIGERNGICSLAELAAALEALYGVPTGVDLQKLKALSDAFGALTRVPTPADRPIVGEYAHTHKLDAHVWGVTAMPEVYEPVPAERVGGRRQFVLGKYSGSRAIRRVADRLGIEVPADRLRAVADEIERVSIQRKSRLSDEDFIEIVRRTESLASSDLLR